MRTPHTGGGFGFGFILCRGPGVRLVGGLLVCRACAVCVAYPVLFLQKARQEAAEAEAANRQKQKNENAKTKFFEFELAIRTLSFATRPQNALIRKATD